MMKRIGKAVLVGLWLALAWGAFDWVGAKYGLPTHDLFDTFCAAACGAYLMATLTP